jgi:uncharacterized protein YfdQ (DUF2303 family)
MQTDWQAVIDAARKGVEPTFLAPHGDMAVYLPNANGGQGEVISLERFLGKPARKRGTVTVFDAASFNMVVRDNEGAGDIAIYVDRDVAKPSIEAVLNGHGKTGPGWGDLRARIEFRPTPQWTKWKAIDGKLMPQVEFAEFIEDNLADIAEPSGAELLEVATKLQGTRSLSFKRGVRLSDGQVQFEHVEDTQARVGDGKVTVPETLKLALAPVMGGPVYAVPTRFRWRLKDAQLVMGVKLERLEDLMERVVNDVVQKIEIGTNVSLFEGRAPAAVTPA